MPGINLKDPVQEFNLWVFEISIGDQYNDWEKGVLIQAQSIVRDRDFKYQFSDKYRNLIERIYNAARNVSKKNMECSGD